MYTNYTISYLSTLVSFVCVQKSLTYSFNNSNIYLLYNLFTLIVTMASWNDYLKLGTEAGFKRCCIIYRQTYQCCATTGKTDIATLWKYKNDEGKEITVNENQELANDWKKGSSFSFFGKKFNVVQRDTENGAYICGSNDDTVCIMFQFKTIWFIVAGTAAGKGKKKKKDDKKKAAKPAFKSVPDAYNKALSKIWDYCQDEYPDL